MGPEVMRINSYSDANHIWNIPEARNWRASWWLGFATSPFSFLNMLTTHCLGPYTMPRPNTRGRNTHSVARKGLFADGVWKCNCAPRLPADRFETKKAGPNHGRWCMLLSVETIDWPSNALFSLHVSETAA